MHRRLTFLIAVAGLCASQDPVIRLDVQQVLVPVVVTDKKGHHVTGLRASDFRVFEDGLQQEIASFSSDTAGSVNDMSVLSNTTTAPGPAPAQGPLGARRSFVICVDTLHASSAGAAQIRKALETLFEKEKPADAQYILIGIGRQMQVLQAATTNPLAILVKVRSAAFQNALGGLDASAFAAQMQNIRNRLDDFCKRCACGSRPARQNCESETETLKQNVDADAERWIAPTRAMTEQFADVVKELAKLPTARTLILVSDGFSVDPKREFYSAVAAYLPGSRQFTLEAAGGSDTVLRDALQVAAQKNVAIYAIDSRGRATASLSSSGPMDAGTSATGGAGLGDMGVTRTARTAQPVSGSLQRAGGPQVNPFASEDSATMKQLAQATGGVYFHEGNDLLKQFRSALADGREFYQLGYVPKNTTRDGKFRSITVETTDKNLSIRAKQGYWASGAAQ
jgi:VWFA-related protein